MLDKHQPSPKEQEREFQDVMNHWVEYKDKKSWDLMFLRVYEACKALSKRILKVSLDDMVFHDRLMDAVLKVMGNIENGVRPNKLSSYCYFPCLGSFCGPKAVKEDTEYSYELSVENGYDVAVDMLGEQIDIIRED